MPGKEGRPFKYANKDGTINIEEIKNRIDDYIANSPKLSVPGLCVALDITKDTLYLWEKGLTNKEQDENGETYNSELSSAIKKAYVKIEQWLLENEGKNTIKDMAALNHSFGYRDTKAVEGTINVNVNLGKLDTLSD